MPMGLTPFAQMVFTALQRYGAVVTDFAGAVMLQAEEPSDWAEEGNAGVDPITASWDGLPEYKVVASLPWSSLQAVEPPQRGSFGSRPLTCRRPCGSRPRSASLTRCRGAPLRRPCSLGNRPFRRSLALSACFLSGSSKNDAESGFSRRKSAPCWRILTHSAGNWLAGRGLWRNGPSEPSPAIVTHGSRRPRMAGGRYPAESRPPGRRIAPYPPAGWPPGRRIAAYRTESWRTRPADWPGLPRTESRPDCALPRRRWACRHRISGVELVERSQLTQPPFDAAPRQPKDRKEYVRAVHGNGGSLRTPLRQMERQRLPRAGPNRRRDPPRTGAGSRCYWRASKRSTKSRMKRSKNLLSVKGVAVFLRKWR